MNFIFLFWKEELCSKQQKNTTTNQVGMAFTMKEIGGWVGEEQREKR